MPRPLMPGRRSPAKQHPLLRLAASGSKGMYGFAVTWSGRDAAVHEGGRRGHCRRACKLISPADPRCRSDRGGTVSRAALSNVRWTDAFATLKGRKQDLAIRTTRASKALSPLHLKSEPRNQL